MLWAVASAVSVVGFDASPAWAQKVTASIVVFDKKTGAERSQGELFVRSDERPAEIAQLVMGRGLIGEYGHVRFLNRSVLKGEETLKPMFSQATYYDEKDKNIGGFLIEYDHDKRRAIFIRYKEGGKERFRRTFEIEGPICDAQNMPLFLERFLLQHENLLASHFYLITAEPRLYKINIHYRGTETIQVGAETIPAKKIQLIADMGPMTNFFAKFMPKTYLWFTPRKPYRWLQYEGLEKGPHSAHIVVKIQEL